MMSPRMKRGIAMAILLSVLAALVLTSFGCRSRQSRPFQPDQATTGRETIRPHGAQIEEVSLS